MLFCDLAKSRNKCLAFLFLAMGELKAIAFVQKITFSLLFLKRT